MKLLRRYLYLASAAMLTLTSCAEQVTDSFEKYEDLSLKAWMTQNRPALLGNLQEKGGYYIDIINPGDMTKDPLNKSDDSWISFDYSGRDMPGNIILTRRASEAYQVGSFTKYTHYVPFYRYAGAQNTGMTEGSYLAVRNTINLDPAYAKSNNLPEQLELRNGAEIVLYMPSRIVGDVSGSGGYGGQYALDLRRPFIATMIVCDTIKNPLQREGVLVDGFGNLNGGVKVYTRGVYPLPKDPGQSDHPYNIKERWTSAHDTIPQLYVNHRFDPKDDRLDFPTTYFAGTGAQYAPYNTGNLKDLEDKISAALVKRFHEKKAYVGVLGLKDSVKLSGTANIWYIGRFADGFIFDTNIDEVKKLIYDKVASTGTALSYTPSSGGMIQAFYHVVPNLRFGQWATIITTSTQAYGSSGKAASSSSSSSSSYLDYNNYNNYNNYANSYYGSSGYYGGYYGDYYGNYNNGYYDQSYGSSYNSSTTGTTTTTTVSTEIPSFTPLIFEIYVEPKK